MAEYVFAFGWVAVCIALALLAWVAFNVHEWTRLEGELLKTVRERRDADLFGMRLWNDVMVRVARLEAERKAVSHD